jgi:radical SAM superfamily enzyme YgiQ (UPF0313 family)
MKLTLIKPKMGHSDDGSFHEKAVLEPLALAYVAALTPPDVEVVMYDDRIEAIPFDDPTDLVAISTHTFTAKRAYEICLEYRMRGVPVVLGGYHPSQMPEEAAQFADSVYIGDAEALWHQVVEDTRAGRLAPLYRASFSAPLPGLVPRRDIFKGKPYRGMSLVQFSRGCPHNCNFCTISSLYRGSSFFRPIKDVIEDIERQDRKLLLFVDDNIVMNHSKAKELFRALIPLKIHWFSQANITMTRDPELMELMVESGCVGHLVGLESMNPGSLGAMNKRCNLSRFDSYSKEMAIIREFGLLIWAAFTIGHEFDTQQTIEETLEFTQHWKFFLADFNVLLPYPNTALYHQLAREGRLLYDGRWWLHHDYRHGYATHQPGHMTPGELADGCWRARKLFYSPMSILRRFAEFKTNMKSLNHMKLFTLGNTVHFHDTLKKQEIYLGNQRWAVPEEFRAGVDAS